MTQLEQAERRTTILTSAFVSAVIALAITVSAILVLPSVVAGPVADPGTGQDQRIERLAQAEREWQARYEQMYPTR